jgi:hypothetical protein
VPLVKRTPERREYEHDDRQGKGAPPSLPTRSPARCAGLRHCGQAIVTGWYDPDP